MTFKIKILTIKLKYGEENNSMFCFLWFHLPMQNVEWWHDGHHHIRVEYENLTIIYDWFCYYLTLRTRCCYACPIRFYYVFIQNTCLLSFFLPKYCAQLDMK